MGKFTKLTKPFQDPEHPVANRIKKYIRTAFQVGILSFLGYQLYEIGIANVLSSLPVTPLFYLLFLVNYFSLPLFELFIYRKRWDLPARMIFPVFLRKKVLNMDVVGYSGEVYLYVWMKKKLQEGLKDPFLLIKDNNILSSVASTFITLVLLLSISS